jgi:hypothetical protein
MINNKSHFLKFLYTHWEKVVILSKKHSHWIVYVLVLFAFAYLGIIIYISSQEILTIPYRTWIYASLLTLFLYLASLLLQSYVWIRILACHHTIGWEEFWIYFKLLVLRRLPGGVLHWFGRAAMYDQNSQVTSKTVMWANFIEWTILILIALTLATAGISSLIWPVRVFLIVLLFTLAIFIAVKWQSEEGILLRKIAEGILWTGLYALTWLIGGLVIFLFTRSIGSSEIGLFDSTWIWAISGGASLLFLIIPSGLGIREISLTMLLYPFMSPSIALLIALLIRFTFTIADVLWGSLGWVIGLIIVTNQKKQTWN